MSKYFGRFFKVSHKMTSGESTSLFSWWVDSSWVELSWIVNILHTNLKVLGHIFQSVSQNDFQWIHSTFLITSWLMSSQTESIRWYYVVEFGIQRVLLQLNFANSNYFTSCFLLLKKGKLHHIISCELSRLIEKSISMSFWISNMFLTAKLYFYLSPPPPLR